MSNFAKLFQVTLTNQVLIMISYEADTDKDYLIATTIIDGVSVRIELEYETEDSANKAFDDFNQERATEFYSRAYELVMSRNDEEQNELFMEG